MKFFNKTQMEEFIESFSLKDDFADVIKNISNLLIYKIINTTINNIETTGIVLSQIEILFGEKILETVKDIDEKDEINTIFDSDIINNYISNRIKKKSINSNMIMCAVEEYLKTILSSENFSELSLIDAISQFENAGLKKLFEILNINLSAPICQKEMDITKIKASGQSKRKNELEREEIMDFANKIKPNQKKLIYNLYKKLSEKNNLDTVSSKEFFANFEDILFRKNKPGIKSSESTFSKEETQLSTALRKKIMEDKKRSEKVNTILQEETYEKFSNLRLEGTIYASDFDSIKHPKYGKGLIPSVTMKLIKDSLGNSFRKNASNLVQTITERITIDLAKEINEISQTTKRPINADIATFVVNKYFLKYRFDELDSEVVDLIASKISGPVLKKILAKADIFKNVKCVNEILKTFIAQILMRISIDSLIFSKNMNKKTILPKHIIMATTNFGLNFV